MSLKQIYTFEVQCDRCGNRRRLETTDTLGTLPEYWHWEQRGMSIVCEECVDALAHPNHEKCQDCDGSGLIHSHNPHCYSCNGTGWVEFGKPIPDRPDGDYREERR